MTPENRIQTLYEGILSSRQVFRRSIPETSLKQFRVPQTSGTTGWIVFTYDNDIPVCLWMTTHECRKIQCIADERLFGDTFIRAEKLGQFEYVVADIFIYNSNCIYACSTFEQRYEWLKDLLKFIHHVPGTAKFIHKSDLNPKQKLKGYEVHIDDVGKPGYFVDLDTTSGGVDVVKLSIPDCYEVSSGGYLRVPNLKTSEYLRSKGQKFKCRCSKNDDGSWTVLENIP